MNKTHQHRVAQLELFFESSGAMPLSEKPEAPKASEKEINIKTFINSIIKQRQMLLNSRGNRKNVAQAQAIITKLTNSLNAYNYTTIQLAHFFLRNYDEIFYLLPPNRQKAAIKLKTDCLIKTI